MNDLEINIIPCLNDNYAYIISFENQALVIDPSESLPIIKFIEKNNLNLKYILNTHHHFDHVGGNLDLKKKYNASVIGSKKDKNRIPGIDLLLSENEEFIFNGYIFKVIEVPGHTLGHIAFYLESKKAVFTGDTIFSLGCGKLFEGTSKQMWDSICKIRALPRDTQIYCGHEYTLNNALFTQSIKNDNKIEKKIKEVEGLRKNNLPSIPTTVSEEIKLNLFFQADKNKIKSLFSNNKITSEETFALIRSAKDSY
tara:strand:+ start:3951 stop:4712 length:762 start_codon:yes stop_codon:yes gene_type:complete